MGDEAENIQLNHDDGKSILHWVEWLQEAGSLMAFKSNYDPVPAGFEGLHPNTFCLIIHTPYWCELFHKEGHRFARIDATHNTTHYDNTSLFMVMVWDT